MTDESGQAGPAGEARRERCATCRWWLRFPAGYPAYLVAPLRMAMGGVQPPAEVERNGQCRRMPPRISEMEIMRRRQKTIVSISEFPDTPDIAWCGEWTPRPAEHDGDG